MARTHIFKKNLTWRLAAARVPGNSHVNLNKGSDDAFSYVIDPRNGGVVISVADGAGSRSGTSALGAFAACRAVTAEASELIFAAASEASAELALRQCFANARIAVDSYAEKHGLHRQDLATTLAVAVLTPKSTIVAQIGDGIIVCEIDAQIKSLIPEEKGEYVNEVVFLTTSNAVEKNLRIHFINKPISKIVLSTDGLRYKILHLQDGGTPFKPFFEAIWCASMDGTLNSKNLSIWLSSLDDQTGDDKTLVVGTRVDKYIKNKKPKIVFSSEPPMTTSSCSENTL